MFRALLRPPIAPRSLLKSFSQTHSSMYISQVAIPFHKPSTAAAISSPFTQAVVAAMQQLYPEELADESFDNTGLLLEAPLRPLRSSSTSTQGAQEKQANTVLLTIDLTRAVADEAIRHRASIVVAYHPIIFRGLKAFTLEDTQQASLLRLAAEGISVYSPHTAVDAALGGLGDWMADIVTGTVNDGSKSSSSAPQKTQVTSESSATDRAYSTPSYPSTNVAAVIDPADSASEQSDSASAHSRTTLKPKDSSLPASGVAGMGRLVIFNQAQPLRALVDRIGKGVGSPKAFGLAIPQGANADGINIGTVAVCAGSGSSVFRGLEADLFITGELSHHEALAITEQGGCVVTLFHSNSERGYLRDVMQGKLQDVLAEMWPKRCDAGLGPWAGRPETETARDILGDRSVGVIVSEQDRDPYGMVVLQA